MFRFPNREKGGVHTFVFGPVLLLLGSGQSLHDGGLLAGVTPAVDVLGKDAEAVLLAGLEVSHGIQLEPGVSAPRPSGHRELLLFDDVVGDGRATVPQRLLPLEDETVSANLAAEREARRVWPVANGHVDDGKVLSQLVLGGDGVGPAVDLGDVHDG